MSECSALQVGCPPGRDRIQQLSTTSSHRDRPAVLLCCRAILRTNPKRAQKSLLMGAQRGLLSSHSWR